MSTLKTTNLQHASAASPAIVLASDGTATAQLSSLNGQAFATNRIINGDMRIDQRNAGAAITGVVNTVAYMCDRFYFQNSTGATVTIQQSTTAPTGFTHSAYVTVTSTGTPSFGFIQQNIEGNNIVGLGMNSASSNITISFWVRSSLIGTYSVSVQDSSYGYSYNATYSISVANTWEYKSVTVPGYASGTWNTGNTQGMALRFALVSSASGTPNTWVSGSHNGSTNNVNWFANSGATFYITGVQLEPGSVATPFERRSYGQELALCQRYYETGHTKLYVTGNSSTQVIAQHYAVRKRATSPSVSYSAPPGGGYAAPSSLEWNLESGFSANRTAGPEISFTWASSSEL